MRSSTLSALEALRSERPLLLEDLRPLSDLDSAGVAAVEAAWGSLPAARRRLALEACERLARDHIELNFDRLSLVALRDPDARVRQAAVANLWENDDASLLYLLLGLLRDDPDLGVRAETARALGKYVYQSEVDGKHAEAKRPLEDALLEAARGEHPELRISSLESLGHSSRAEVTQLIEEAYRADSERSRQAALLAMGRSGDKRWNDHVMTEMRSASPALRREAAHAAGELELRAGIEELAELLQDTHAEVLQASIWALGQIGGKAAEKALHRFLRTSTDEALTAAAEEALEYLAFLEETRDLEAGLRALDEAS